MRPRPDVHQRHRARNAQYCPAEHREDRQDAPHLAVRIDERSLISGPRLYSIWLRRVLAHWQRSGLTLREFGEKRGIPPSTLSWWRQVFRRAGEEKMNRAPAENAVVFTEVPQPARLPLEHETSPDHAIGIVTI